MTLSLQMLHPLYGAEIAGIDLRDEFSDAQMAEIVAALEEYAVAVVRHATPLTDIEHIAFSRRLGPIEDTPVLTMKGIDPFKLRVPHHEIVDQSNLDDTGRIYAEDDRRLAFKRANRLWHTDISFAPDRATFSLLSAHALPDEPPPTEFADMRAAWDALPENMKRRIEGLQAEHSYWYSRVAGGGPPPTEDEIRSRPPARHPLVHVRAGRKALYLASHAYAIDGWPEDEARDLLDELRAFATRPEFVYAHDWRVGDVLIWDNLATMHRATPYDDRNVVRDVRRTTCREDAPGAATQAA